jgi:hypothetical protein
MRPADILFPQYRALRDLGKCPCCTLEVNPEDFRDNVSRDEYRISGLCQTCQDATFAEYPED